MGLVKGAAAVLAGAAAVTGLVVRDVEIPLFRTDTVSEELDRVESVGPRSSTQENCPEYLHRAGPVISSGYFANRHSK